VEWNLRDRLQQAEQQRRLAAGLPPAESAAIAPPSAAEVAAVAVEAPTEPAAVDLTDPSHVLSYSVAPKPVRPTKAMAGSSAAAGAARSRPAATWSVAQMGAAVGLPVWQGSGTPSGATTAADDGSSTNVAPVLDHAVMPSKAPVKDPCPSCRGRVRLERFDLDQAVAYMRCTECGHTYTAKSPKL